MAWNSRNFAIETALKKLGPLARANLFLFEINSVPGGGSPEDIVFSAESAGVPKVSNEAQEVPWMNGVYKTPGVSKYDTMDVSLRVSELDGMKIYDTIYNWYKLIYNPETGIQRPPAECMVDGTVTLLNYQGEVKKQWKMIGMFPLNFGGTPLNRDTADKQAMPVTFAYTYAVRIK